MYLNVPVGKRGEIVIPSILRKRLGILPGNQVKLGLMDDHIEITAKSPEALADFERIAMSEGIIAKKLAYGDRLYEELFK